MVLVIDPVELGLEVLWNVHLDDIDVRHGRVPLCWIEQQQIT